MAWRAAVVNLSWIPYVWNSAVNCATRLFLGDVRIETSWERERGLREQRIGMRPRSSGMRP